MQWSVIYTLGFSLPFKALSTATYTNSKINRRTLIAKAWSKVHSTHCCCQNKWTVEPEVTQHCSFKPITYDTTEKHQQSVYEQMWFYASGIQASITLHLVAQAWPFIILQCISAFYIQLFLDFYFSVFGSNKISYMKNKSSIWFPVEGKNILPLTKLVRH